MSKFFECKVKYHKVDNAGKEVSAIESYLVDAVTFGEAESRITKELESVVPGELFVSSIKRVYYTELVQNSNFDRYFRVKVAFMSEDESNGKLKKVMENLLVQADTPKDAMVFADKALETVMMDYEKVLIAETAIMDVFLYDLENQEEE
jgi:hypothetical protein